MNAESRVRYWRWFLWAALACLACHWLALGLYLIAASSRSDRLVLTRLEFVTAIGCIALALAGIVGPGLRRRVIATMIMLITVATALLSSLLPNEVSRVRLRDGQTIVLAKEFSLKNAAWSLWRTVDSFPMMLRSLGTQISYSEDLSWTHDPALILSPDGRYLLVHRGGIWTDCLVVENKMSACLDTVSSLDWQKPEEWIRRSERIEEMTGLSAGPRERRQPLKRS